MLVQTCVYCVPQEPLYDQVEKKQKTKNQKGGQWLPAVKFTAHSRQDAAIMSVSEAG